jgi:DNA-binding beta-propeller fold protein YncE
MMRALLFTIALAIAFPSSSQQEVDNPRRGIESVEALLKQRPNDPTLWFYLARLRAAAGELDGCVAALEKVLAIGNGFLPPRDGFEKVWDAPAFQSVRAKLEAKLPRLDFAPTAFELEDRMLIPEGIAYDPHSQSFFVGSVNERKIVRIGAGGAASEFSAPSDGLDHVLGLAVDSPRRILYAVSTSAVVDSGGAAPRNAIFAFDVDSARLLRRVEVPGAKQLNDVTVARGGRVFTSDSASGAIYEIPKEAPARAIVAPGVLRGSNGLAVSPDAKRLYVAHATGIAMVDLADTAQVKRVAVPESETVAAIDGLYEWQGQLVGVQNVTTPGRVILMTLSSNGAAITRVQTLLSHHHRALDEPTTGAITERGFFLLAATGVSHFNREGRVDNADALPRPTVLRIPLTR